MKYIILPFLLFSLKSFATSPVVSSSENSVIIQKIATTEWKIEVGSEMLSLTKEKIKRKALFLGLKLNIEEEDKGKSSELKVKINPAVDQEEEFKDFSLFLKENF